MENKELQKKLEYMVMPVAQIEDKVFFPDANYIFDIPADRSAIPFQRALEGDSFVFMLPSAFGRAGDIGSVAKITDIRRKDGTEIYLVKAEIIFRAELLENVSRGEVLLYARVQKCVQRNDDFSDAEKMAFCRTVKRKAIAYSNFVRGLPRDFLARLKDINEIPKLTDFIIANIFCEMSVRREFLSELDVRKRFEKLCAFLQNELTSIQLEQDIEEKLKIRLDKQQRDYQLREKMNVIAQELGDDESLRAEVERYRQRIINAQFTREIEEKLLRECNRLSKLQFAASEAAVLRTYLDTCLDIPWNIRTKTKADIGRARKILDRDHYGLEKVKERILESIAVIELSGSSKGNILCLVGPPGVGKTSIAQSVAKAMNRNFVRISLGGVRDEAEIRGHRRTYIGSMPGRIAEAVRRAKSINPLILLDEIDKLGNDYKGDPSSALLEVLDPEQNSTFADHYLDMPLDLSEVFFITTANDYASIPAPLRDRMDIITLSSYTAEEKLNIAKRHLVKKQVSKYGLTAKQLKFSDKVIAEIIDGYTKEAGVRTLERKIASVCRKAAKLIVSGETELVRISDKNIHEFLGVRRKTKNKPEKKPLIGVCNGLAWTSIGGEMLEIEVSVLKGSGKIQLTGSLGDVMKESAMTAITFIRSKAEEYGIDQDFYNTCDIHIHAPEGAVPKDGPSAGVTMTTAIVSALTGIPVSQDIAMTGEISLRGRVMPIGGLKEKSMAAYMSGVKRIIIPEENLPDLEEISETVKNALEFVPVKFAGEVIEYSLIEAPSGIKQDRPFAAIAASAPLKPIIEQTGFGDFLSE